MLGLVAGRAVARAASRAAARPAARREQRRGLKNKNPFVEEFDNLHADMHKKFDIRRDNVVGILMFLVVIPGTLFYILPQHEYYHKGAVDLDAAYRRKTAGVVLPSAQAGDE
jgi:hypothetical protein